MTPTQEPESADEKNGVKQSGTHVAVRWPSLHRYMLRADLDDEALGERVGRRGRGVACWIRGERHPPLSLMPQIARALVIDTDPPGFEEEIKRDLLGDVPPKTVPAVSRKMQ